MIDVAAVNNGALPPFSPVFPPPRVWGRTLLNDLWWDGCQHRGLGLVFMSPLPPPKKESIALGVVGAESASAPSPRVA